MKNSTNNTSKPLTDQEMLFNLEGRPKISVALPVGLQHVLAMFTSNLAPVTILTGFFAAQGTLTQEQIIIMIQCAMFVSGLTTLIQLYPIKLPGGYRIGANLPIVMGTSFAFVPTIMTLAANGNTLNGIIGAAIVASLVEVIMGFFYKPLEKIFPPIVVGTVLITIGINLLKVGVDYFAGGFGSPDYGSPKNLFLGFLTFTVIIALQRFGKGMWKISAILIGLVVGYIVSIVMNVADLSHIANAGWFSIPRPVVAPWDLEFKLSAILAFAPIFVVSGLETIGNVSGITIAGFDREATPNEVSGGIIADALGSTVAGLFTVLPNTAFGQNAGIVAMTKVVNKWAVACGALVLIGASFMPKIGAIFNAMPASVLGGAVITVFAMILINGIKMVAKSGFSERNILVLSVTFGIGLGLGSFPEATAALPSFISFIFSDTVASVCIVAIIANLIFPTDKTEPVVKY